MKYVDIVAWVLVVVGALNWGLIGFFDFNLVSFLFGGSIVETIVYDIVGISAVYHLIRCRKKCGSSCSSK
jgi:uncharacterized membrane protein YuzA (DUF378 family)